MHVIFHPATRAASAVALMLTALTVAPATVAASPSDRVVFVGNRSNKIIKCFRIHNGRALPAQELPVGGGLKIEAPEVVLACHGVAHAQPSNGGALLSAGHRYQLSRGPDDRLQLNHVGLIA